MTTSALTRARRAPRRLRLARPGWPQAFLLPALAAIGLCFLFPLVQVVRDSFYAGSFDSPVWVGLANYRGVIDDPEFRQSSSTT